jgi:hypothetical protein
MTGLATGGIDRAWEMTGQGAIFGGIAGGALCGYRGFKDAQALGNNPWTGAEKINNVNDVAGQVKEYLGENYRTIENKYGDNIFMSENGIRKIRFDINNSHGDLPHFHIENFRNGKWYDALDTHRFYPKP